MISPEIRKYIFYCKPNAGLIDAWLPVIARLRERCDRVVVVMVAYDLRVFLDLSQNVSLMKICAEVVSSFYVPVGNRLLGSDELESVIGLSRIEKSFPVKMLCSVFPGFADRIRDVLMLMFCYLVPRFRVLDMTVMTKSADGLLYDARFSIDEFPRLLGATPRYALPHGYSIIQSNHKTSSFLSSVKALSSTLSGSDFVFVLNEYEYRYYSEYFPSVKLFPISPPKYDDSWVSYLQGMIDVDAYFDGRPYAVLLSKRGGNMWLSKEKRAKFIQIVKNVVIDGLGVPVIVKLHPVERDVETYFQIFGRIHYGQKWCFSGDHPLGLSVNALFAISLMSSTCIDLLANNVPVIQLSNNDGMSENDKKDYFGEEMSDSSRGYYRDSGLVLGAETEEEFKDSLAHVVTDPGRILRRQKEALNDFIYHTKCPIDYVCEKIIA